MEFRLALRSLFRRPVLTGAIITAIALAVAINTALFSVMDGLMFRPLPFSDPNQLVAISYRQVGNRFPELAYLPNLVDRRKALREAVENTPLLVETAHVVSGGFFRRGDSVDLGLEVHGVDSRFFRLLGLTPAIGRTFDEQDERSSSPLASPSEVPLPVVIGHEVWRRLYAEDPGVIGVRELAGRRVRIVGVMPPGVKFPAETNVWAALPTASIQRPPTHGRLASGTTVEQLSGMFPDLEIKPLREATRVGEGQALVVLFCAAGLLLLVTWVQVGALMFSAAIGRLQEIGVRLAIGASRGRIFRQFAVETTLVGVAACSVAWLAVEPTTAFIVANLPEEMRRGQYLQPDLRTFFFGCGVSLVGLVVLGAVPAGLIRRAGPLGMISGRLGANPLRVDRSRRVLLIAQMTLTTILLYLSGLAIHSYTRAVTLDYGFDSESVLIFTPPPWARPGSSDAELHAALAEKILKEAESVKVLRQLPGVISAANFFTSPLRVRTGDDPQPISFFDRRPRTDVHGRGNPVGRDFVRTLGATMLVGRSFDDPAYADREDVTVITEAMARQLIPGAGPGNHSLATVLGRELRTTWFRGSIIGVIQDLVNVRPGVPPDPQFFTPDPDASAGAVVLIRATPSIEAALPAIRATLQRIWGELPPRQFGLLRDEMRRVLVPYRGRSVLLSLIAAFCLPIAAIGLMGALTYSVGARTREIAIRIALGADPKTIARHVVRQALTTVAIGVVLGTAAGAAGGTFISAQLFNVEPADPFTMVAVAVSLGAIAWLSALAPARRASGIDPAEALRHG